MIKRYNNLSLAIAIPGIALQFVGQFMTGGEQHILGLLTVLAGTLMVLVGFAYYAKAKGRNPAWCLIGVFSCLGLLIMALLKDNSGVDEV
ncbi:MAG: hypothetical protein CMM01_20075 [Rhodopirellula sp.]|nr:hypothetical protein [Rhodopirellula sp.]